MTRRQFVRLAARGVLAATAGAALLYSRHEVAPLQDLERLLLRGARPGIEQCRAGRGGQNAAGRQTNELSARHCSLPLGLYRSFLSAEASVKARAESSANAGADQLQTQNRDVLRLAAGRVGFSIDLAHDALAKLGQIR